MSLVRDESSGTAAARELREWRLLDGQALRGDAWIEALSPEDRVLVREAVARAVEKAARAQGVARETQSSHPPAA
jgi:hypothetical protein